MARVTHVEHARQRYETKPVLDENDQPKKVPVMRDGTQRTTKHGKLIFRTITASDTTCPLPPETCDRCGKTIEVGDSYKWIAPKSGPYGGRRMVRCGRCPTWHRWEYSNSLSARIEQIQHNAHLALDTIEDPDDVRSTLSEAADEIRSLADEKRDSASNIESGFGHETEMSMELNDQADQLEGWADDVETADVPDLPEPDEVDCEECGGTGKLDGDDGSEPECEECGGSGLVTPDEPTEDQMDEWREDVENATSILDEAPV